MLLLLLSLIFASGVVANTLSFKVFSVPLLNSFPAVAPVEGAASRLLLWEDWAIHQIKFALLVLVSFLFYLIGW